MAGRAPTSNKFDDILERGALVDDIFKDQPMPKGSSPFVEGASQNSDGPTSITIEPLSVEEAITSTKAADTATQSSFSDAEMPQVGIVDNDSLFCVNRKFAALEALLRLVNRDQVTFGQLVSEILRVAMEQIKSEAGSFLEVDYQNNCLFFRAAAGRSSEGLLNFTVPLGQGIAGFVCETQQPMALSSVDESSVYLRSISSAIGFEARNMVAFPVVVRGVTFGCLELLNRLGEPQYTDADKEVLIAICDYGARVIENRLIMAAMSKELAKQKTGPKKATGEAA